MYDLSCSQMSPPCLNTYFSTTISNQKIYLKIRYNIYNLFSFGLLNYFLTFLFHESYILFFFFLSMCTDNNYFLTKKSLFSPPAKKVSKLFFFSDKDQNVYLSFYLPILSLSTFFNDHFS